MRQLNLPSQCWLSCYKSQHDFGNPGSHSPPSLYNHLQIDDFCLLSFFFSLLFFLDFSRSFEFGWNLSWWETKWRQNPQRRINKEMKICQRRFLRYRFPILESAHLQISAIHVGRHCTDTAHIMRCRIEASRSARIMHCTFCSFLKDWLKLPRVPNTDRKIHDIV